MHSEESFPSEWRGEQGALASLGGSGVLRYPSTQGNLLLHLFFLFLPLPLPSVIHFPLPMMHFLLSFSKIGPKSSFWIQGGQDSQVPSHVPRPQCPGLGKVSGHSSLLASTQHDLGDKVDDGRGRLVGVQLSEEVAGVVRGAALLPGHEAKEPAGAGKGDGLRGQKSSPGRWAQLPSSPAALQALGTGAGMSPPLGTVPLFVSRQQKFPSERRGGSWG